MQAQLNATAARAFILGGRATVTLESAKTGARYTFRVAAPKDADPETAKLFFVSALTGQDNESDYAYFGMIRRPADTFAHGGVKARIAADAPSARAFAWAWAHIAAGRIPDGLNVWHEGKCGRCNRKLTVPESIASGFGPECSGRMARALKAA